MYEVIRELRDSLEKTSEIMALETEAVTETGESV
jgi:hypothetical protein